MNKKESYELLELIQELIEEPVLIIVEGFKDKQSLVKLGIDKDFIITLKKPFYKIIEEIEEFGECAILTDLDKKGKQYYAKFNSVLPQKGIRIDNKLRHFLFKHTDLRQIEGLYNYIARHL